MAFQREPAHPGDIGDEETEKEPDPDRIYEREIERRNEEVSED